MENCIILYQGFRHKARHKGHHAKMTQVAMVFLFFEYVISFLKSTSRMNDEWSRCPICFEDYSSTHRPTTYACGHSTCIDHTTGLNRLQHCPICRYRFRDREVYNVSYSLLEAACLLQQVKDRIDWSTVKPLTTPVASNGPTDEPSAAQQDEIYARRLQAEFDREARERVPVRPQIPANQPVIVPARTNQVTGNPKSCGHRCDMNSTTRCCVCSDQRTEPPNHLYAVYMDGRRMEHRATRNQWYCPTCKQPR